MRFIWRMSLINCYLFYRSLKSRSSLASLIRSVTMILFSSFKLNSQLSLVKTLSEICANRTYPLPLYKHKYTPAPAHMVLSELQLSFMRLPTLVLLKLYVHPVLSHSLIISKDPTAKYWPFAAHLIEFIT